VPEKARKNAGAPEQIMIATNPSPSTLIKNAHVFDSVHKDLIRNASVPVVDNVIKEISTSAIKTPDAATGATDVGNRIWVSSTKADRIAIFDPHP